MFGKTSHSTKSLVDTQRLTDSFVRMAKIASPANPEKSAQGIIPSSPGQKELALLLMVELDGLGLKDVFVDDQYTLTGTLPSNIQSSNSTNIPTVELIAHLDTANAVAAEGIYPQVHENYQGGDIALKEGTIITQKQLENHLGEDIITSDGTTLLGADNKAGIAEILEILRVYKENPDLKHPHIKVAFTADGTTGHGWKGFNIKTFDADAAYTIDGTDPGEIQSESFNAHNMKITFHGKDAFSGFAKGKMVNSMRALADFITQIPLDKGPESSEEWEGYIHPASVTKGSPATSELNLYVRDFDEKQARVTVDRLKTLAKQMEEKYPGTKVEVEIEELYKNMAGSFVDRPWIIDFVKNATERLGLKTIHKPLRGGNDGSNLSVRGLPTPTIGAGSRNVFTRSEFVTVQDMQRCADIILHTLSEWVKGIPASEKEAVEKS